MADLKISQLTDGGASQATDEYVVARSGSNFRIDGASVAAAATSVGTLSSLTVSGDLTVDTSTLKVDSTNNLVGIGGNPGKRLDVIDTASVVRIKSTSSTGANAPRLQFFHEANDEFHIAGGDGLQFYGSGTNLRMTLTGSGNLGLGVTPSAWATYTALQIKNGSIANYSPTQDMRISSNAYYTSGVWKRIAAAYATQYLQDGSTGTHAWFNAGTSTADSTITFTQAMTLDASGNLGVGTGSTAPAGRIDAVASSNGIEYFSFRNSSNGSSARARLRVGNDASENAFTIDTYSSTHATLAYATLIYNQFTAPLLLGADGAEKVRITSGGYFKASNDGTYANVAGLYHEFRNTITTDWTVRATHSAASPYGIYVSYTGAAPNGTGNEFLYCEDSSAQRAAIRSNGGLANYSANNVNLASDFRLKKDIAPLASTWDKLKAIEVVNFRYKDCNEDDPALYGVIAQQVQPIVPELVVVTREAVEAKDAELDEDGNEVKPAVEAAPEYYGIREQPMYWLAIKALQEAQARIEALEARLEALEA